LLAQLQLVGETKVKVEAHVIQFVAFKHDAQLGIAEEQELHEPEAKYSVALQLQLVAETRVKVVPHAVQAVELVQAEQLLIDREQSLHCPEDR